jgi:hypothetical protein
MKLKEAEQQSLSYFNDEGIEKITSYKSSIEFYLSLLIAKDNPYK